MRHGWWCNCNVRDKGGPQEIDMSLKKLGWIHNFWSSASFYEIVLSEIYYFNDLEKMTEKI